MTKQEYIKKHVKIYYKFNQKPKFIQTIIKQELSAIYEKYFTKEG